MKCALRPLHKAGTLSLARRLSVRHSVCPSSTVSIIVCLLLKYCRFSVAVTRWTQSAYTYSYSTLGPVSARVGEHASLDGKPSRRRTRHPGLLSLSPSSAVRLEWIPGKSWGVNRHIAWYVARIRGLAVFAECMAGGLACRDQRRRTGSGSTLKALRDDALYKYTFSLLTLFIK